jgi:hypothetical protein
MRKPQDFDGELKALRDKARDLKGRKGLGLGELVIATGAASLGADEPAGALIAMAETKDTARKEDGRSAAPRSFRAGRGELHRQLNATPAALNRQRAARARHDLRIWQVERGKRTRHLIELSGLVVKAGIVDLTGDDRATIFGALLWSAGKLKSDKGERAQALCSAMGKQAFEARI